MRGAQTSSSDSTRRAAFEESVHALEELDLSTVANGLLGLVVGDIDAYQRESSVEAVIRSPFPATTPPALASDLVRNTSVYPSVIEDTFDEDPVIKDLVKSPASDERTTAIRARRSTLVLGLLAYQEAANVGATAA